jgi:osmotically-inducible protein OsmY
MNRSDEQIRTDIENSMRRDGRVVAADVKVEVKEGVATLSGTVPDYGAMWAAQDDAMFTNGVVRVVNILEVLLPENVIVPTDVELAQQANNVLQWASGVDAHDITVTVKEGAVTLAGTVPNYWERDRAAEIVCGLRGVRDLTNNLAVVPTEKVADEALAKDIVDELERSLMLDASSIKVGVADGVVMLTGEVSNTFSRWRAERIAQNALGVQGVEGLLDVKYL